MKTTTPLLLCCLMLSPVTAQDTESRPAKAKEAKAKKAKAPKRGVKRRQGGFLGLFISDAMQNGEGVVTIDSVFAGSDAEKLGFKPGDEVVSVNRRDVSNGDQFIKLLWMSGRGGGRGQGRGAQRRSQPPTGEIVVRRKGKKITIEAGLKELDAHPKVGDKAPAFKLRSPDGKTEQTLAKLFGKPVVLIFGSYT